MSAPDQSVIEQRLRDAFTAAGETVQAGAIRDLPRPASAPERARGRGPARAWTRPRAGRPRRFYQQALVPVAAAAAVALIATTMTVIVPKLLPARPGTQPDSHPAVARGNAPVRPAGPGFAAMPRFFVGIRQVRGGRYASVLDVYSSLTGRVVARVPAPGRGYHFQAATALGNDRTFVAATNGGRSRLACHTVLWRFNLTPKGQPTGLRRLLPYTPGVIPFNSSLAGSADGRVIAYAAYGCTGKSAGRVVVIHLATGAVRTWTTVFPSVQLSLSLSADGALLGFLSDPSSGPPMSSREEVWVLRTDSSPGPLASHYRKVLHVPGGVSAAALSRTGATLFAVTPDGPDHQKVGSYLTATGRPVRLLRVLPLPGLNPNSMAADVSGDYAVVYFLELDHIQELNLATGQLRSVPSNPSHNPLGVAW